MKRKVSIILTVAVLSVGMMTACGKKKEDVPAENMITPAENVQNGTDNEHETDVTDPVEDTTEAVNSETDQTKEEVQEDSGVTKEYHLQFYQYGEYLDAAGLRMTDTDFIIYDQETGETEETYSYTVLTDSLVALYVEDAQAYTVCYYKISGFDYTLNILGATAETMVGSWPVYYTDQAATANIEFMLDGVAIESKQTTADGVETDSPYEFYYCWYVPDDTSLFLFVCLDNGYYAYSVELTEDGTLNLTENGAYTYDL